MVELSSEKYISKNTSDFSFTNEIIRNINNTDFLKNVNIENVSSTKNTYNNIYLALSAISDILGTKIYDDILNYIDNVGNVDICKTKTLQSMIDMFGIYYSTFNILKTLPLDLLHLIDILSITPKYLLNSEKINTEFVNILSSNILKENNELLTIVKNQLSGDQLSDNSTCLPYLDINDLDTCISTIYKNHIESIILSTYYDNQYLSTRIIDKTYTNYVKNNHLISIREKRYDDEILKLKTKYKIPLSFNEIAIADDIDKGIKKLEDFNVQQQEILKIEINRRFNAYNALKLETRGKFYKEKYVLEYITFVEQLYSNLQADILLLLIYNVDSNYSYLNTPNQYNLLSTDSSNNITDSINIIVNTDMILNTVNQLLQITKQIREIRQSIKNQALKNFMKGTFLFISYVINEYLKGNIIPILKQYAPDSRILSTYSSDTTIIEQINYIDPVNYFNISTDIDAENNLIGTNTRFWEEESTTSAIIAPDNTNIFLTLPTTKSQGFSFSKEDLENFYINVLKNLFSISYDISANSEHLFTFLNSIFETGADKTFYKDNKLSCFVDDQNLSSYKNELYMKYSNNKNAETPYYYHTNTIHPSYQIHPYLSTFIEAYDYSYDIENMPILAEQTMYELLSKNLDAYIDADGYLISVWNNPLNRNSDYLTYYEKVLHLDNDNVENKLIGYDGLFYPEAVAELVDFEGSIEDKTIKNFVDKWYTGLNISLQFKARIELQISAYIYDIKKIAKGEYYDIYQYGKDIYGNIYVLIKKYGSFSNFDGIKNINEQIKKDTPGELWIRFKNHPIAFPAFNFNISDNEIFEYNNFKMDEKYDNLSQIDYNQDTSNTVFKYMIDIDRDNKIIINRPLIYDFFISTDKTQIELYGQRLKNDNSKTKTVVTANILQINNKNIDFKRYVLRLNSIFGKTEEFLLDDGELFKCFYSHKNSYPGFITVKKNSNEILLACKYFEYNKPIKTPITGNITLKDDTIELSSILLDVYNDSIDIAYLENNENENTIQTYFEFNINKYSELSSAINIFENKLVLHTLKIGNFTLINDGYKKYFLPFTDMGFLPLIGTNFAKDAKDTNNIVNVVSESRALDLLQSKGILKFLLVGDESKNGIDFIPTMPIIRKYESMHLKRFNEIKPYKSRSDLSVLSYSAVHYFENSIKANLGNIYDPYEFKNKLLEISDNPTLNIKVNESFRETYLFDKYVQFPYLIDSTSNFPNNFVNPGSSGLTALTDIKYILAKITSNDTHPLSISYCYRSDISGYKIDINLPYYNHRINDGIENKFNYQHTFLNLDYPGAAGYLKTYNENIKTVSKLEDFDDPAYIENVFYIKNISDNIPKILLSALNFTPNTYDAEIFGLDECTALAISQYDNNYIVLGV